LAVYDVSSRDTFDELLKWSNEVDTYCGDGVVKVLVGNKVDKVSFLGRHCSGVKLTEQEFSRQVSTEEGQEFADRQGTLFVECSAKTNVGVGDIFDNLVRKVSLYKPCISQMLSVRSWRNQNYGQEVLKKTRSFRSQKTRMIERDGVDASGPLELSTLYVRPNY
jgi:GTPase SAR1 family protein